MPILCYAVLAYSNHFVAVSCLLFPAPVPTFFCWHVCSQSVDLYLGESVTDEATAEFTYVPYSRYVLGEDNFVFHSTYVVRAVRNDTTRTVVLTDFQNSGWVGSPSRPLVWWATVALIITLW